MGTSFGSHEDRPIVVEAQAVSAGYSRDREALSGVDLTVHDRELVAVVGPNGAGKSTLLRVLSGILRPERGTVRLFGTDLGTMSPRDIARSVAVVRQVEEMAFGYSVQDVVMMGRAPHQGTWMVPAPKDRTIVEQAMQRCELVTLADRPVQELSGGEQKRVAIARALAQEPRLLLLDEASAFLDIRHQLALYELLVDEMKSRNLACITVVHDLNMAAQYASRVALLKGGRLVAVGRIEDVMTYRRLQETFEVDLYCGVNEINGTRFFLPMRAPRA